jgi:2-polyprenyl-3-methyl-5-hydroxy-6-metoxy-1,4-benzoquinol methylase
MGGRNVVGWRPLAAILIPRIYFERSRPGLRPSGSNKRFVVDLITNYSNYDESGRMFTSKSKNIEFRTTIHFFDMLLSDRSTILELGAGGGIYTEYLANQNHQILSSDILPKYVEIIKAR